MFVKEISKDEIEIDTPAKINLFLDVLNKREDGFHNINSLFQAVSLFDKLQFKIQSKPELTLKVIGNNSLPVNDDNLIVKAYNFMREKFELTSGLHVTLHKEIPIAAGLGGGSSDAAATILACNILFDLELTSVGMAGCGLHIGSDLPFFFSSGQALVTGQGEIIENTSYPVEYELVIVKPNISISTAESYAALKRDLTKRKNPFKLGTCRTVSRYVTSLNGAGNDFEEVHLLSYPEIRKIKDGLLLAGAELARMSGSGPCVFGVFMKLPYNKEDLNMSEKNWQMFFVKPIQLAEYC